MGYWDNVYRKDVDDRKSHLILCFTWVIVLFLEFKETNSLLLSRFLKLNLWQQHHVHVMSFGSEKCWRSLICHILKSQRFVLTTNLSKHLPRIQCIITETSIIDTRYHFIRECIAKMEVELKYVKSHDQVADIFTKSLKFKDFQRLRSSLII